ncbi:hypothetical protein F2Q70_00003756 [Brassica cretica]|uniref:DUF393 domain-containing protein n=1 Tax=Brassica cretica TaxID=69181 RepID=A0A8S9ITJ3_BRACR|nr:hypothetical protein F2Q70_00003756 [Brassica cretica]
MATRGAAAAFVIWKHRNNPSLRSISSHHFYPIFKPQIIPKGCRYQIRAIQGESVDRGTQSKNNDEPKPTPENWKIKMLYDGDCPLCMREVNMLKERNEEYGTIKFVDISSNDYSPQENQGLDYKTVMGQIHAIQSEGNVVTGVEAFRKLYELVGLGWVYSITKFEPVKPLSCKLDFSRIVPLLSYLVLRSWITYDYSQIGKVADAVYDFWAKYRLQVTGRPPIEAILEARKKNKGLQHLVFETGGEASELKSINNSMVQKVAAPSILEELDLREYEDHITRPPDYMECPIQVTRSWGCKVVRDERSMLILDHTGLVQPHDYLMMFMNVSL